MSTTDRYALDITEMDPDVLWCRTFRHSWVNYAKAVKGSGNGYAFTLQCPRCGTLSFFQWTRRGGKRRVGYAYPDKYLARFHIDAQVRAQIGEQALIEAGILPAAAARR